MGGEGRADQRRGIRQKRRWTGSREGEKFRGYTGGGEDLNRKDSIWVGGKETWGDE